MEYEYDDYESLIAHRARAWMRYFEQTSAKRSLWTLEDLMQEGAVIFCKCRNEYNPQKGTKFSTFLWNSLNIHFGNIGKLCHTNTAYRPGSLEPEQIERLQDNSEPTQDKYTEFVQSIERAGFDGKNGTKRNMDVKKIIGLVLNNPDTFVEQLKASGCPRVTKRAIQKYVIENWGWNISRTWEAFKTIRSALA